MKDLISNRAALLVMLFLLPTLLLAVPVSADPGTLYVDDDGLCDGNSPCHLHPQDAVNFANPGDKILVYPGTYSERRFTSPVPPHWGPGDQYAPALIVFKNGLTIEAVDDDPSQTIIQTTYNFWVNPAKIGGGGGGSIEHSTGCVWNAVNKNDPVTKGWDDDPATPGDCVRPTFGTAPNGIAIIANDVTIDGFTVLSTYGGDPNNPSHPNTGGVFVGALYAGDKNIYGFSGTTIKNCVISGYSGVRLWKAPYTTLENNLIDNNIPPAALTIPLQAAVEAWDGWCDSSWCEGPNVGSTHLSAVGNQIFDYKSTFGITLGGYYNGPVDHTGLYVHDNTIEGSGWAVRLWNSASANVEISGNTIYSKGGIDLGAGGVHDSLIEDNYMQFVNVGPWGHGVFGQYLSSVEISHNDIQENPNGWAMAIYDSTTVSILGNVIIDNAYGIATVRSTSVVAHCNTIVGNGEGFGTWGPYPAFFNVLGSGNPTQYIVDATVNWWGDVTGPNHPTSWMYMGSPYGPNPGAGDSVSDYVLYDPWKGLAKIDIKPGSYPNSINLKSKGVVPVALLGSDTFDVSTVDLETVLFAGVDPVKWAMEDVNGDDYMDIVFFFNTQELVLDSASIKADLIGLYSIGGESYPFLGSDSVNIVSK